MVYWSILPSRHFLKKFFLCDLYRYTLVIVLYVKKMSISLSELQATKIRIFKQNLLSDFPCVLKVFIPNEGIMLFTHT